MYKRLTLEGLEWVKAASKDMKKRTKKNVLKKNILKKEGVKSLKNIQRVYLKKIKINKQNLLKEQLKVTKKENRLIALS
jgi:hypothetical protein